MDVMADLRARMVAEQLFARGITDKKILRAMRQVPREEFIPAELRQHAYRDAPLPIGEDQTISQPYVVALMLQLLELQDSDRCLEVGTGSGYAAAVISRLAAEVITVERHASLARGAQERLDRLGYHNVRVIPGNGTLGWPESAPYDGILFSAGAPVVPQALRDQLSEGGRLVGPVGQSPYAQELVRVRRTGKTDYLQETLGAVQFVPLLGRQGWPAQSDQG